jgi:outer membrane scaffolding protein for murein synthesis (MipA/OmpV family)
MKTKLIVFAIVTACFAFVGMPASSSAADVNYSLGAGVGFVPDYEGSEDYEAVPVPYFSAQWEYGRYLKLDGSVLKANLLANKTWSLGPLLQYRKKRDDDVDNDAVSKMQKIDAAVEAGAFLGYKFDSWDFGIQIATDVSDKHDGTLVTARTGYTFKLDSGMKTRIGASISYADDNYMDTYFSVDDTDSVRSGLSVYKAESGIKDIGVDLMILYSMTDNWDIRTIIGYFALLNDAEDSPIVNDEGSNSQTKASVVLIYNF